jgi:predicted PurR-regulated permease PerM
VTEEQDPREGEPREEGEDQEPVVAQEEERRAERLGERLTQQLAQQWALMRAERRAEAEPVPITAGVSNFSRAQVPWGLDLAAAWSWRLIVIAAATYGVLELLAFFAVITLPLAVSLLIAALASPLVAALSRIGLPRSLSSLLVVLLGVGAVGLLLTVAGRQVATGASGLADQVVQGLGKIRTWLRDGPLDLTDSQVNTWIQEAQQAITERSRNGEVLAQVTEVGATIGHVLAGFFIVLFATYFFLADGHRIWSWAVRLSPRAAREHVDSSGRVAWVSLTQFVRATVVVALVDAIGVGVVAAVLGVPFVLAIGVLVFLGAFVPMVGATVAGAVAVLVALVDQGLVTALLMLGGVILVQQIEGNVLQPFLMGRFVALHPLGVIVAIGAGVLVAGIAGALIAVPLAAAVNAVVQHLAASTVLGEDEPDELLHRELADDDPPAASPPPDQSAHHGRPAHDPEESR